MSYVVFPWNRRIVECEGPSLFCEGGEDDEDKKLSAIDNGHCFDLGLW